MEKLGHYTKVDDGKTLIDSINEEKGWGKMLWEFIGGENPWWEEQSADKRQRYLDKNANNLENLSAIEQRVYKARKSVHEGLIITEREMGCKLTHEARVSVIKESLDEGMRDLLDEFGHLTPLRTLEKAAKKARK